MKTARWFYVVGLLIVLAAIGVLCGVLIWMKSPNDSTELKQVHVIFNHGERTPTIDEIDLFAVNENFTELYHPYGLDALTNKGKMTMYQMGLALRSVYDIFLNESYHPSVFKMQAADTDISKMSALLVLAGLWPVREDLKWIDLSWQPIPYFNLENLKDFIFYEKNCPKYIREKESISKELVKITDVFYKDVYTYLTNHTGYEIIDLIQVKQLRNLILTQEHMEISAPTWSKSMEKKIKDLISLEYNSKFYNQNMQRFSSGSLLQIIVDNAKEIIAQDGKGETELKMFVFSGYSNNIASLLTIVNQYNIFDDFYGSFITIELHKRLSDNDYGFKIFYYKGHKGEKIAIDIPKCGLLCLVKEFKQIMSYFFVEDFENECKIS